jgi:hypothetical protein
MNPEIGTCGREIPFLGIFVSNFRIRSLQRRGEGETRRKRGGEIGRGGKERHYQADLTDDRLVPIFICERVPLKKLNLCVFISEVMVNQGEELYAAVYQRKSYFLSLNIHLFDIR